ncbi:MAG: hypothetical protein ABI779_13710 [Acidobacteriota bacterium]
MFDKKLIAILAVLLLPYCATSSPSEDEQKAARANADASKDMTAASTAQLAVEVEITASSVTPVGATIVQAPPKTNSAIADLRVQAVGADRWEYTMADPRLAEIDDANEQRAVVLPTARWYVYAPLSVSVTAISVQPVSEAKREVSRGGTIDVRGLAAEACRKTQSELPTCREIVAKYGRVQ